MLRKTNPVMRTFRQSDKTLESYVDAPDSSMSINGTLNKTLLLLIIAGIGDYWSWNYCQTHLSSTKIILWVGLLGGAAVAFFISFKPNYAPHLSPLYALLKGVFLGAISIRYQSSYPGVVFQAVGLTFAIVVAMVILYRFGAIRINGKYRKALMLATFGIMIFYLVSIVAGYFFNTHFSINSIMNPTKLGIAFSLFTVSIASLNLVLDFQFIERGARKGLPKYMEWYGAFGLMVTIVWMYIEVLKLIAKMKNR